ncbi:hypothetical protein EKH77_23930 [Streptomyces luteoverticillatus]|uniref:Uncharacterized protein n=1 Tax=Streptomyces luteoverticillatus TaxID=66425 RepID=A0A3Q9G275_STRLT|nr:hypothetical protein [Streptomyces luteoverticillatus]AZQ73859.1 hypothetical protein EKH77_23930 [Streptomyces luteoverticillatus]
MTTDLALLTTAAEQWEAAAKKFESVQKDYESQVKAIASDGTWTGQANLAGKTTMQLTHEQYTAAAKEARAIASLLRDAHGQFTDLRGKLKSAVADAEKAGMKVSEGGIASFDFAKADAATANAARHDPDLHTAEASWTKHIDNVVRAFDDADQGVKLALQAAVQDGTPDLLDGTPHGFNAQAEGDIEKVEAKEAYELATKLTSKGHLDARDMAEMQRLFRDNGHDKAFSQTFLNSVGPDGTIQLTNKLTGLAYSDDKSHKQAYDAIQAGLAGTVSTATADTNSSFYDKWHEKLRQAGGKNFGSKTDPLYGYQSFVNLMGYNDHYGNQFLNDLGNDIIATEKKQPSIWTQWRRHPGLDQSDPLDHLLGVMSKNPDAATSFLDPGDSGKNDHLKYLLKDREWPKIATAGPGALLTMDEPTSKLGLGQAIEAAATGHAPLPDGALPNAEARHNQAQARVMHDTVELVDPGSSSAAPANLRRPLANALAEYSTDTHEILSAKTDYQDETGVWSDDGKIKMSVGRDKLLRAMRGLAEDPLAYATLHHAESRHISHELGGLTADTKLHEESNVLDKAGAVLGSYGAIREDVINDERSSAYTSADWKAKVAYHILGGAVTPMTIGPQKIPIGDALQRGVDTWAWAWSNDMKSHADTEANAKIADHYMDADRQMRLMIKGWAADQHISEGDHDGKNIIEDMTGKVMTGSVRGNVQAKNVFK